MQHLLTRRLARLVTRRPGAIAIVLLLLVALSAWRASKLHINHNQLDLIPQDLPSVQATRQMIDVVGGVGFLIIALESDDLEHLKGVADDLAERLLALPEIREVTYKQDMEFMLERIGLYVQTPDLQEAYRRIHKKIRSTLRKANPFHFELRKVKEEPLDLSDLVAKYRAFNRKGVDDPYYLDPSKRMLLLLAKPKGDPNDLVFTHKLLSAVEGMIADYNAGNGRGAHLVEGYNGPEAHATVTYGYTGAYKRNLDDSETIEEALVPTSAVAFLGILLYLLFFLRRPAQIGLIMLTLVASVVMTFAFCEIAIGELNVITAILGAILMGVGIDFGIHLIYRLREEYTRTGDLVLAIETSVEQSGSASATSALTITAALYVLGLADFKGFSHFGLVTGTGVLITAMLMYTGIPVAYVLLDRVWPSFKNNLTVKAKSAAVESERVGRPYPFARPILVGTVLLTAALAYFATQVRFDYDARALMTADRPSVVLQEKINRRFGVSSDPVGVFTETLAEAKALYEALTPVPPGSSIDSVISLFTAVPPAEQQRANRAILDELQHDLEPVRPEMLDDAEAKQLALARKVLAAQPFTLDDLPEAFKREFRPVPESSYDGYLTFIYPNISIWDGREIIRFADEVGTLRVGGHTYHSAGMAVLYADLAKIVLRDGRRLTLLAAAVIFLIILLRFRSLRATLFSMVPLIAGMIWMLGLMALTGWRINFMNVVVFPVVFGYGISSGVHLFHRYMEGRSVMLAVRRTGAAVAASSITTLVGWASLLISHHRGLTSMGILACFGITSALVVSLTVLPAVIQVSEGAKAARDDASAGEDPGGRRAS